MRRHQLFAAAVSVALLFGAASPALAAPGKGKAKGHSKPAKAPKTKGIRLNGGGVSSGGAEFSVQVRSDHPKGKKGHFNYTKAATLTTPEVKIRCKSVAVAAAAGVQANDKAAAVTGDCVEGSGTTTQTISVKATFYDNPAGDRADIIFTRNGVDSPADSGAIEGSIHVRP